MDIRARINFVVDKLAGKALITGIVHQEFVESEFPFETMRIYLEGKKMTGSPRAAIGRHWGEKVARRFFHEKHLLNKYEFHLVAWDEVENAMSNFSDGFRRFVTKHVSKFCGTNRQLSWIDDSVSNICPSCGRLDESSKHITCCTDPGRQKMLAYSIDSITKWMGSTGAPFELVGMVRVYLTSQDTKTWKMSLGNSTNALLSTLADVQDKLGWDSFVEGRVSTIFKSVMRPVLKGLNSRLTPERWCTILCTKLLELTHKQWLFRNSHVHFKKLEGLTPQQHAEVYQQVKSLEDTDPDDLLPRHQHLLERDMYELGEGSSGMRQQWVASMEAALQAAVYVHSGRPCRGYPGLRASPAAEYVNVTRPSSEGSMVYCRRKRRVDV